MARLPDQFDLWIRRARECEDPSRQVDFVIGSLLALTEWYFLNIGTKENPEPAMVEIEDGRYLLVFSDAGRIEEVVGESRDERDALPVIRIPGAKAMAWCIGQKEGGCSGLLVNPGDYAALIPMPQLEYFQAEWEQRGAKLAGFWIPNLTTEEEDFWQQHGL